MTIAPPPVHDVILDEDTLAQLFFDVGHAAELIGITLKQLGARQAAPALTPSLDEAYRALVDRTIGGVQLRYRFAGEEWCDTLFRAPAGVRLIRISHTAALAVDDQASRNDAARS